MHPAPNSYDPTTNLTQLGIITLYIVVKTIILLILIAGLGFAAGYPVRAQDTNKAGFAYNFVNAPMEEVLRAYENVAKAELVVASNVREVQSPISLHTTGGVTREAAQRLLEQALLKQAGIVLTRLKDGRISVTYNGQLPPRRNNDRRKIRTITLTPAEVDPKSVRITTKRGTVRQPNLAFLYVGKTSDEIKKNVGCRVQIKKGGKLVLEAPCSGGIVSRENVTNYIGMMLIFDSYEHAELAEKTLRRN